MKRFQTMDRDFDYRLAQRVISGRLTPKRAAVIKKYAAKYNQSHSAPYGVSPNGYPYSCGCEHDCCGCLCSDSMNVEYVGGGPTPEVKLTIRQSFNY